MCCTIVGQRPLSTTAISYLSHRCPVMFVLPSRGLPTMHQTTPPWCTLSFFLSYLAHDNNTVKLYFMIILNAKPYKVCIVFVGSTIPIHHYYINSRVDILRSISRRRPELSIHSWPMPSVLKPFCLYYSSNLVGHVPLV